GPWAAWTFGGRTRSTRRMGDLKTTTPAVPVGAEYGETPRELGLETPTGVEFEKRARALSDALSTAGADLPLALLPPLKDYFEFLTSHAEPGPGAAAEVNAVLWEVFPVRAVES